VLSAAECRISWSLIASESPARVEQVLVGIAREKLEMEVVLQILEGNRHDDDLPALAVYDERPSCEIDVLDLQQT
jgi:hypothetical protein